MLCVNWKRKSLNKCNLRKFDIFCSKITHNKSKTYTWKVCGKVLSLADSSSVSPPEVPLHDSDVYFNQRRSTEIPFCLTSLIDWQFLFKCTYNTENEVSYKSATSLCFVVLSLILGGSHVICLNLGWLQATKPWQRGGTRSMYIHVYACTTWQCSELHGNTYYPAWQQTFIHSCRTTQQLVRLR